jgi:hypothetical protein
VSRSITAARQSAFASGVLGTKWCARCTAGDRRICSVATAISRRCRMSARSGGILWRRTLAWVRTRRRPEGPQPRANGASHTPTDTIDLHTLPHCPRRAVQNTRHVCETSCLLDMGLVRITMHRRADEASTSGNSATANFSGSLLRLWQRSERRASA